MEYKYFEDKILLFDGDKEIGEVLFPIFKDEVRVISRTYVDPNYRSGGIASKLVEAAYEYLKQNHFKAVATCPYVVKWLQRYPEKNDIIDLDLQANLGESCAL